MDKDDRSERDAARGRDGSSQADHGQAEAREVDGRRRDGQERGDQDGGDQDQKRPAVPRWKKALYWTIGGIVALALIVGGVLYYLWSSHFQSTDDAFVDGYISRVSAQVSARVEKLLVQDNQQVRAGDVLIELDPRDYQARVDQARASLGQAEAALLQAQSQLAVQQANVDQSQAQVRVEEATLTQTQQDLARYQSLDPRAIARQTVQNSSQGVKAGQARLTAAQQAVTAARAQVKSATAQVESAKAQIGQAQAQLDSAQLNLNHCKIKASVEGRITQRTVDVGNYVSPGQALLAVVPSEVWVTANFKETQLAHMQVGQAVQIHVDAFGVSLPGHVNSFQRGSGTVFSTLPAENATGNYVKVVQRVPVKITFDGEPWESYELAPGLSVEPRVTVR